MIDERPPSGDERPRLLSRLRPDTLGEVFGATAAVGGSSLLCSFFGLVLYTAFLPEGVVVPQSNPLMIALIVSWACLLVSLFGYVVWAGRWLKKHSQERRDGVLRTMWATGDRSRYERRQRRMLRALGVGAILLLAPVGILAGAE